MENVEMLSFEEVIRVCHTFIQHPDNLDARNALEELKKKVIVRAYLPMEEKIVALYQVMVDSDRKSDTASVLFTTGMEIAFFFNGLLAYTNIEHTLSKDVKTYEVYDIFYQSGLADYILEYCARDYDRLVRLMERSISYENMKEMIDALVAINSSTIQQSLNEFKEFEKNADPNLIKNLADIVRFNDPTLYELKDRVIDEALDKLEKADELEKLKQQNE